MKKDGTLLEIKVIFKQDLINEGRVDMGVDNVYCDKNFKDYSTIFMLSIAKAIQEANKQINEVSSND